MTELTPAVPIDHPYATDIAAERRGWYELWRISSGG